jgi:hypothetical protein
VRVDPTELSTLLPGTWRIAATNLPFWLDGARHAPTISYEVARADPLALRDTVEYRTRAGESKTIVGMDRLRRGMLRWRGNGLLKLVASTWWVTGAAANGEIIGIEYEKTTLTPAGVDVLQRDGNEQDVRRHVASRVAELGLTPEQFASLTWIRG